MKRLTHHDTVVKMSPKNIGHLNAHTSEPVRRRPKYAHKWLVMAYVWSRARDAQLNVNAESRGVDGKILNDEKQPQKLAGLRTASIHNKSEEPNSLNLDMMVSGQV